MMPPPSLHYRRLMPTGDGDGTWKAVGCGLTKNGIRFHSMKGALTWGSENMKLYPHLWRNAKRIDYMVDI